jgi:4-hydroxy-2-oxoheptanedioate aldolase
MTYETSAVAPGARGRLRDLVTDGRMAYGGWCTVPSAFATEVVSAAGCDWICIDLQHGLAGEETMRLMVQAAAIRNTPVLVRVPWNEPGSIMRALDAGAEGVIVPMVNTAEDALQAAAATMYPPLGIRSWGPIRSTMAQPGFNPAIGNEQVVCLVMIETVEAYANLDSILEVKGVHGAFVGPNDLAISHSGSGEGAGRSPRDVEMIERIAQACADRGLVAGSVCTAEDVPRWHGMGYAFLGLQSDVALLSRAMADELAAARSSGAA